MSFLNNQVTALSNILKTEEIKNYAGSAFTKIIKAVISGDMTSLYEAGEDVKELICHFPTLIFWDKMQRFLIGSFKDFEAQIKLARKLDDSNDEYQKYVKRLIHLINEMDDDAKIDYFAMLTRCFLITELDQELYFKLTKYLCICTPHELEFLADTSPRSHFNNDAMISSLYQYGLFSQTSDSSGDIYYELSGMATALKQNCLNFDDGLHGEERITSYALITPVNIVEHSTWKHLPDKTDEGTLVLR